MIVLALFACAPPPPAAGPSDSAAADTQVDPCGTIYAAQAGYDLEDPEVGDPDEAAFGAAPDPALLHLSWVDDPSTSIAAVWTTDSETFATRIEWGLDETYGNVSVGRSFLVSADLTAGRAHEARLCGLEPGTTYHYRVGGEGHWSADHSFTTAPPRGEAHAFRFLVVGDSREEQTTFATILDQAAAFAPDFLLFTGDAVQLGVDMEEWHAWFAAGEGHFESMPTVFTHGNHEFQVQNWYALFAQPGNEQWFSFDYADAHFAILNDTVAKDGDREVQAEWLAADLAATDARWRFAAHHMPAYSSCTAHGSDEELQALWSPVEEAGGVAVDFAGHNHNYERSVPLAGGVETTAEAGTTYIVAAGAGAELYSNYLENSFTAVAAVTEHYVIAEVADGTLTLTAYDLAGNVLDTFTTTR